jgi:hypothetical protein
VLKGIPTAKSGRCNKRYIARQLYRILTATMNQHRGQRMNQPHQLTRKEKAL